MCKAQMLLRSDKRWLRVETIRESIAQPSRKCCNHPPEGCGFRIQTVQDLPWKKWCDHSGQMAERAGIAGGAWTDVRGWDLFMEHWVAEHLELRGEQGEQRSECEAWSLERGGGGCLQTNVRHKHTYWLMEVLYLREHRVLVYWTWHTLNYG